jgi:hypothetical protein
LRRNVGGHARQAFIGGFLPTGRSVTAYVVASERLTDARSVKGVKVPDYLLHKWDLGDAVPADLDPIALIGRAVDVRKVIPGA